MRNPPEHFTPHDVAHLMGDLRLAGDADHIRCTVYDPCWYSL